MRVALTTSRSSSSSNAVRVRSLSDSADIAGWMASSFGWWGMDNEGEKRTVRLKPFSWASTAFHFAGSE